MLFSLLFLLNHSSVSLDSCDHFLLHHLGTLLEVLDGDLTGHLRRFLLRLFHHAFEVDCFIELVAFNFLLVALLEHNLLDLCLRR